MLPNPWPFLTVVFCVVLAIMLVLLPFFVLRIRNEVIALRSDTKAIKEQLEAGNRHLALLSRRATPESPAQSRDT